jgi:hypothetical protein
MLGSVRGMRTGVLRAVSEGGLVYRIVPGRSYMHTWVYLATPLNTEGDAITGGSVSVSVQGSEES